MIGDLITYTCKAGLVHLFNGDRLPDGKYYVQVGYAPGIYVNVIEGYPQEISKAEFESDVPTVDPPY